MIARRPGQSLPKQAPGWADLKAAYRFLSNPRVEPFAIGAPHRALTRRRCRDHPVVLCVQDGSDLQAARVEGDLYVQQSSLALTPGGEVLGLLDQRWYQRVEVPRGETQRARQARWRESDIWSEAVAAIGTAPEGCRLIHVADRAADDVRFMRGCLKTASGFVVRARHDRRVEGGTVTLWSHLQAQPAAGTVKIQIGAQRGGRGQAPRQAREATVELRYRTVRLDRPSHDSQAGSGPLTLQAVYLREVQPPQGVEPVDWMLLTSEPLKSFAEALVIVGYYQRRWVIEEWHRCLKEGCILEQSQVDEVEDLQRLAALLSVIAVRMMAMRDLVQAELQGAAGPKTLQSSVPWVWILVVANLFGDDASRLTPRQFWRNIARQGGWIGRKNDGLPGWKVIWRGWYDVMQMVRGAELARKILA